MLSVWTTWSFVTYGCYCFFVLILFVTSINKCHSTIIIIDQKHPPKSRHSWEKWHKQISAVWCLRSPKMPHNLCDPATSLIVFGTWSSGHTCTAVQSAPQLRLSVRWPLRRHEAGSTGPREATALVAGPSNRLRRSNDAVLRGGSKIWVYGGQVECRRRKNRGDCGAESILGWV